MRHNSSIICRLKCVKRVFIDAELGLTVNLLTSSIIKYNIKQIGGLQINRAIISMMIIVINLSFVNVHKVRTQRQISYNYVGRL